MLNIGDKVIMNNKYLVSEKNQNKVFIVRSEEQVMCGEKVVWLNDYKGCYSADGLTKVKE